MTFVAFLYVDHYYYVDWCEHVQCTSQFQDDWTLVEHILKCVCNVPDGWREARLSNARDPAQDKPLRPEQWGVFRLAATDAHYHELS